jgi:hypothetical protein
VGEGEREQAARRLFFDEARRRVLSLLCDLRAFVERWGVWPPPWTWVRLAALGEHVIDDGPDVSTAALDDAVSAVEREIRSALAELASSVDDRPIPYRVLEPLPAPPRLRPYLAIVRGGIA